MRLQQRQARETGIVLLGESFTHNALVSFYVIIYTVNVIL